VIGLLPETRDSITLLCSFSREVPSGFYEFLVNSGTIQTFGSICGDDYHNVMYMSPRL